MHVWFLNYGALGNTSGIHIFHLANEIVSRGVRCTVLVPDHPETVATFGTPQFEVTTFRRERWRWALASRRTRRDEVILHAWTPREPVRIQTTHFAARLGMPYVVHLEDNETRIYESYAGFRERAGQPPPTGLIDPQRWRPFLAGAAAITCLTESLREFCPSGVPGRVFWPGCEEEFFGLSPTPDRSLRRNFDIAEDAFVLFYPGNIHPANAGDVAEFFKAADIALERHIPLRVIRTGRDHVGLTATCGRPAWLVDLGERPASDMPRLIGMADACVQPGGPDDFNTYRFPSKLPMFLASARPVVLPACNIADHLVDGRDCLLTRTGSAEEIAAAIAQLYADPEMRARLGRGGRAFAAANLRWSSAADTVVDLYETVLAGRGRARNRITALSPQTPPIKPRRSDMRKAAILRRGIE